MLERFLSECSRFVQLQGLHVQGCNGDDRTISVGRLVLVWWGSLCILNPKPCTLNPVQDHRRGELGFSGICSALASVDTGGNRV